MIQLSEWLYPIGNGLTSSGLSFLKKASKSGPSVSPTSHFASEARLPASGSRENLAGSVLLFTEGLRNELHLHFFPSGEPVTSKG